MKTNKTIDTPNRSIRRRLDIDISGITPRMRNEILGIKP